MIASDTASDASHQECMILTDDPSRHFGPLQFDKYSPGCEHNIIYYILHPNGIHKWHIKSSKIQQNHLVSN